MWKRVKDEPWLEKDYRFYDRFHPVMPTKYLSREELGKLYVGLMRRFYSDPSRPQAAFNGDNRIANALLKYYLDRLGISVAEAGPNGSQLKEESKTALTQ